MFPLRQILKPLSIKLGTVLAFLLRDEFAIADDAPMTTPRTCEPTGQLTLTQTAGQLSVSNSEVVIPLTTDATGAGLNWYSSSFARATGLACFMKLQQATLGTQASGIRFGWHTATPISTANEAGVSIFGVSSFYGAGGVILVPASINTYYWFAIVLTSIGYKIYVKVGSDWKFINAVFNSTTTPLYAGGKQTAVAARNGKGDSMRIAQLGSPFTTDFGSANTYIESPAAGSSGTVGADGYSGIVTIFSNVSLTVAYYGTTISASVATSTCSYASASFNQAVTGIKLISATATAMDFAIRYTDDNNCWIIRVDTVGDTIKIIEKNTGVETERASVGRTMSNFATLNKMFGFSVTPPTSASNELERFVNVSEYIPDVVLNLGAYNYVYLSWTDAIGTFTSYTVERSLSGENNWSTLSTPTCAFWIDGTATLGVAYDYRVKGNY